MSSDDNCRMKRNPEKLRTARLSGWGPSRSDRTGDNINEVGKESVVEPRGDALRGGGQHGDDAIFLLRTYVGCGIGNAKSDRFLQFRVGNADRNGAYAGDRFIISFLP